MTEDHHLTIGEFSQLTRLSAKALRLYHELGLVVPSRVDPDSGYRLYSESQVPRARLVALLRRLEMPLSTIARVVELDGEEAARALTEWWAGVEATAGERRELVAYLRERLTGGGPMPYQIEQRSLPARTVVSISRYLRSHETDAFFDDAFGRLRALGPGLKGIAGAPYLIFYGEVSEDSDGPMELCRPVAADREALDGAVAGDMQVRIEGAHDEGYIRMPYRDVGWPAIQPAIDALERWTREQGREPAGGGLRQVLIWDQRQAEPDTLVLDLTIPLR